MKANIMPIENDPSRTSNAPNHTIAILSTPNTNGVRGTEAQAQLLRDEILVHGIHDEIEPSRLALLLAAEELDRLHATHRLEEMALLLGRMDDVLLGGALERIVEEPAQQAIERDRAKRDAGQCRAVHDHHRERDDRHQAVDERLDEARCQRSAGWWSPHRNAKPRRPGAAFSK
jgi:hypothetical protein